MLTKISNVLKVFLLKGRAPRIKGVSRTQLTLPGDTSCAQHCKTPSSGSLAGIYLFRLPRLLESPNWNMLESKMKVYTGIQTHMYCNPICVLLLLFSVVNTLNVPLRSQLRLEFEENCYIAGRVIANLSKYGWLAWEAEKSS